MEKTRTQYEEEKIMSLYKQMALTVSLIIITMLASVMALNYQSSKQNMIEGLYQTTVNNISSITSKLSEAADDTVLISTIIDSEFDSGYYKSISFKENNSDFTYTQIDNDPVTNVPQWFVDFTTIKIKTVTEDVSSEWKSIGTIIIDADDSIIYQSLYKTLTNLLTIFIVSIALALIILSLMLKIILKPLKGVQKQAEALIHNEFIIQKEIPYTQEFKDVVLGMNNMVAKVKIMFEKGNAELQRQKELEYIDPITKLKNRKYLIDKLPEYLKIDAKAEGGTHMMIALSGMQEANAKIGHQKVDDFFKAIALLFGSSIKDLNETVLSRINGTEFSILIPSLYNFDVLPLADEILENSKKIITAHKLNSEQVYLSIGIYEYNHKETIAQLLSQSDNALAQAKFNDNHLHLAKVSSHVQVMGKEAWRNVIKDAINNSKFHFVSYSVRNMTQQTMLHNVFTITLKVDTDTTYYYGQFMASANQIGLSDAIYINILDMMFKRPNTKYKNTYCSLRLPYDFLEQATTYNFMKKLFSKYAHKLPFKLIIEMPDKLVNQNSELVHYYKRLFDTYKIDMGIFEFIGEGSGYEYLQELRPLYIKAESDYFLSQTVQGMSALHLISDSMGIELIATSVMEEETLLALQKIGIHTIQGKATEIKIRD